MTHANQSDTERARRSPRAQVQTPALSALILVAFALRLYRLAAQDVWGDEAFSIFLAWQSLDQVVAGGADTHPPFYPLLLFLWLRGVGESAFATRALSALIGVLAVPLIFGLARRVSANARVAWFSAILTTVSPLLIYYSQETRMYELVTVLMLASAAALPMGERGRWTGGTRFFAATALGMYTHYSAFYVWIAENVFVAQQWARARRSLRGAHPRWLFLQLALVAIYVPWIIVQSGFLSGKSSARFDEWSWRGVEIVFGKTLRSFSAGLTGEQALADLGVLVFGALFLLGARAIACKEFPSHALVAPLGFLIPVLSAWVINPILPFFFERYVLVALPGFYLTTALGLEYITRRNLTLPALLMLLLLISNLQALSNYYFNDAYAKGKYGALMAHVAANAQAGDALVLNNPLQKPLYRYYQPSDIPAYFLPDGTPLEDPAARAQLEKIAREHARIWLVQFGNPAEYDPTNYLQRWLGANAHKGYAQGFVDAALSLYLLLARTEPTFQPVRATLDETIQLAAYALDRDTAAPREGLRVTLQWRAHARIEKSYKVFVHLIGGYNPATASPVWAQMDGEPVGGTRATNQWQAGEVIQDRYGLLLPGDIPPGEYEIEVGMYDPATGTRLPIVDAQGNRVADARVILATVRVNVR